MQEVVAVDIGNSAIKLAARSNASVVRIDSRLGDQPFESAIKKFCAGLGSTAHWHVCCVDQHQALRLEAWIADTRPGDAFHLIAESDIDLASTVNDRQALGRDRLLGAWYAATQTERGNNTIFLDGGTATTVDVVVADRGHIGGMIYPGAATTLSALSEQTAALPDLARATPPTLSQRVELGNSTEPAILLGVHQHQRWGTIAMVEALEQQYATAQVWCCGGALESAESPLPEHWNFKRDFLIDAIFHLGETISQ